MLNRKLLEVLRHLNVVERKRLRQFLTSPYFNSGSLANETVQLYDLILRHNAEEEHPELSKQAVFRVFFPGKPFQEKTKSSLDSLTSKLFRLVRHFLSQTDLERENGKFHEHLSLAKFYRKFAYEERFWQTMQTVRKLQRNVPLRDASYYFNQLRVEEEEVSFRGLYNSFEDDANLNEVHKNLDMYYSILKLEFTCIMEHQRHAAQIDNYPPTALLESILTLSEEGGPLDIPINRIFRIVLRLMQTPEDTSNLESLENLLGQYESLISAEQYKNLKTFYRFLWHQAYYKSGDDFARKRIFEIYKEHLQKGYFYFDGLIPLTAFRNLVVFGLILGEFDWAKNFLDSHPPERIGGTRYPAEIHSLNLAEYHFYLKEYDEAQNKLIYRHFENPTVSILTDVLLIKIYFETQNELLDSRMKALDQKIRRSKLSREVKNRYYNFLKKLDKIIKYGWQTKNPERARLIEEIKTSPEIIAREWLLEKLA